MSSLKAEEPRDLARSLAPFLAKHCLACHGPDQQQRKLRFDRLSGDLRTADVAAVWTKALDRFTTGEMPPHDEPRPAAAESAAFVQTLRAALHQASRDRQRREGRVVLRRLNRTEYETTLRDLFGAQLEVKDLLPEDNIAAGFDNVSAALDVSSVHLLRYQEAAERAVLSTIPARPPSEIQNRRTGRQVVEATKEFADYLGKSVRLVGDDLTMYVRMPGHVPCATATAPQAGRYRVRASLRSVGTDGRPLPVLGSCRLAYGRDDDDVRIVRDVPAGKTLLIDEPVELKARETIVFSGWALPTTRDFAALHAKRPLDQYAGPGLVVEWLELSGPLDSFPSPGFQRLFAGVPLKPRSVVKAEAEGRRPPAVPARRDPGQWIYDPMTLAPAKPRDDAERLIREFVPVAFRRPAVDESLVRYFVRMAHDQLDAGSSFQDAMTVAYKAVLCSPHFLYLAEPIAADAPTSRLDDYALASRLSYFLWSSAPDAPLLEQAAAGNLQRPDLLRREVDRMLADPRARRFSEHFVGQWLELRNINATSPDPQIYAEFNDFLFWSMPRETRLFFDEVLKHDLPVSTFVDSSWTFLNQRLAQHYGVAGVDGGELRKVELPAGSHRGGVLTHASVLKVTADGTRTSPVLRGKWVLEHIVGRTPPPPPPDVPAIEPDIRGATTIRQQLDRHRNTAACAVCHVHIDPPGFALETFDVIGGWRDFYRATQRSPGGYVDLANYPGRKVWRGPDVERGSQMADGREFRDIDDYKKILLSDPDQLARNMVHKLVVYATGADLQFADREEVERLVAVSRTKKHGFKSLLHEVVQSRLFLEK